MKKLKRYTLFALSDGVNFLIPVERFGYMTYKQLYWRLDGFKATSIRVAVNELISEGFIDRILRGSEVQFRLTKVGRDQLTALFPYAGGSAKPWDLSWRMLFLQGKLAPREQRILRKLLTDFGFTRISRGVYISPFSIRPDVQKRLIDRGFLGSILLVETKRFIVGDDRSFAAKLWGLDTIYNKYQAFISQAERVLYRAKREKELIQQLKEGFRSALFSWYELLREEPGLPARLLPADWPHLEARNLMIQLAHGITELEENNRQAPKP